MLKREKFALLWNKNIYIAPKLILLIDVNLELNNKI